MDGQTSASARHGVALDLATLTCSWDRAGGVRKADLRPGDWAVVKTRNSVYLIGRDLDGRFTVSGGWFDNAFGSPVSMDINGCTWGGHAIHTDLVAAPGLFLEFANRVKTTRIREVRLYRTGPGAWVC